MANRSTESQPRISHADIIKLKSLNTCTIYNGWERVTSANPATDAFNLDETRDFMPHLGPMCGFAVTLVIQPGNKEHIDAQRAAGRVAWLEWLDYVASQPGPKIIVVQDLDSPANISGSFWGEVSATTHRALGCEGVIVDGAVRDIDEMTEVGFKALARRLCVGHAYTTPVRWGEPVTVFGRRVEPGQLIHADKHGFLAIPREDETKVLDAARFLDDNECDYLIPAVRDFAGLTPENLHNQIADSLKGYIGAATSRFSREGEWAAPVDNQDGVPSKKM